MIQTEKELNEELILDLIDNHDQSRFRLLQKYYAGKSEILNRQKEGYKPNNKLINNYAEYITDMMVGYSTGKPITYGSADDDLLECIQEVFNLNDEQDQNSELDKMRSINGVGYEIVYLDEESNIRFNEVQPESMIIVYDTKISPDIRFAIRYYEVDGKTLVDVYDVEFTTQYVIEDNNLVLLEHKAHYAGQVPIVEYLNNTEKTGDFEKVISLIDAYDKIQSDTLNDMEQLADAYLCLEGMMGTQPEDIAAMREDRAFLLPPDSKAYYLLKDLNDTALENMKDRLNSDIHKFAKIPDMADENFKGQSTGVAMKYKLFSLEQIIATKERKFKRGLQKRLEIICHLLGKKGKNYDYRDMDISFTRNMPINELELVQAATQLKGLVSEQTVLSTLPFIDDVNKELEIMEKEKQSMSLAGEVFDNELKKEDDPTREVNPEDFK